MAKKKQPRSGGATPSTPATIHALDATAPVLPPHALINFPAPVLNQGDVPCCVSIAISTAMEMLDARHGGHIPLAPLFNYYYARPNPAQLDDLQPAQGLASALMQGIARSILHAAPLTPAGASIPPSPAANGDGLVHRIAQIAPQTPALHFVNPPDDLLQWKTPLAHGLPVIVAFWTTPEYFSMFNGQAVHPAPAQVINTQLHAVIAFGYADNIQGGVFLMRDARGPTFASQGYWQLPYHLVTVLVHEAWVITSITYDS